LTGQEVENRAQNSQNVRCEVSEKSILTMAESQKKDGKTSISSNTDDGKSKKSEPPKPSNKAAEKKGTASDGKKIPVVVPSEHFDLKQYANRYVGHTKVRDLAICC
jgi:hypothetical protein